jgi:hypothetical protein
MRSIADEAKAKWTEPTWLCADSRELPTLSGAPSAVDFILSCPPYFDLERYSDDGRDLSNCDSYDAFLKVYREIIKAALQRLAADRFCCFIVGEIRDADGFCRNFVGDTITAFAKHGARLYNHAVMMLPLHSLPMRAPASFNASAKLGTCHQHGSCAAIGRRSAGVAARRCTHVGACSMGTLAQSLSSTTDATRTRTPSRSGCTMRSGRWSGFE